MNRTLYSGMEQPTVTTGVIFTNTSDPAAEIQDFERVVQFYWLRILRFVMASVGDRDVAETLTQDCFWYAYRSRHTFRGDSSLNTWLMRIAVNSVRKFLRNRRLQFWRQIQRSSVEAAEAGSWLPDRSLSPEIQASVNQQVREVWDAAKHLPLRQRTVFLLRFMEEMSVSEICEATGLSEGSVNVHLFRAVRAVRKRLGRSA